MAWPELHPDCRTVRHTPVDKEVEKMNIQKLTDASFGKYGKVVTEFSFEKILKEMEHTPLPEDVIYVASVEELEALPEAEAVSQKGFGGLPIQIGYCNGDNYSLNAVEYHRSSEIDIAVTDLILLLGCQQDIQEGDVYDTSKIEAFFVPAATAVELYATTLHYAPCTARKGGFRCAIILPKGSNDALSFETSKEGENRLLAAVNKWLIAHEEAGIEGAFCGLQGENPHV